MPILIFLVLAVILLVIMIASASAADSWAAAQQAQAAIKRGFLVRYPVPGYRGHEEFVYDLNMYPDFIGSKIEPIDSIKLVDTAVNINLTAAPYLNLNVGETKNLNRLRGCESI